MKWTCSTCQKPFTPLAWQRKKYEHTCRPCVNARERKNRAANPNYAARQRVYAHRDREKDHVRARERKHAASYREKYPEKERAKRVVRAAIVAGLLTRPRDNESNPR